MLELLYDLETRAQAHNEVSFLGGLDRLAPVVRRVVRSFLSEVNDGVAQSVATLRTGASCLVTSQGSALSYVEQAHVLGHGPTFSAHLGEKRT